MGKKVVLIIIGIALLLVLVSTQSGSTGARPSDTEGSAGNIFTAAEWRQSDCLIVDTSHICIGPCGRCLCGIKIQKDCQCEYDVTMDKVRLSWEPDDGEKVRLFQIWVHDLIEWWGNARSGTELDIRDFTLDPCDRRYCICFCFDSDMHGKAFTLEFIMGDGTTVAATFDTPARMRSLAESGLGEEYSCSEECCEDCCPEECWPSE